MNVSERIENIRGIALKLLRFLKKTVDIEIDQATVDLVHCHEQAGPEAQRLYHLLSSAVFLPLKYVIELLATYAAPVLVIAGQLFELLKPLQESARSKYLRQHESIGKSAPALKPDRLYRLLIIKEPVELIHDLELLAREDGGRSVRLLLLFLLS